MELDKKKSRVIKKKENQISRKTHNNDTNQSNMDTNIFNSFHHLNRYQTISFWRVVVRFQQLMN